MRRFVTVLVAASLAVLALAAPASALKPDRFYTGPAPDLVVEGICAFPVLLHDAVNNVHVMDFFDQDGNLIRESANGRIVENVSRLHASGDLVNTIKRNISGPGTFTFDDEGFTLTARGPSLFWFLPGEVTNFPDGLMWFTSGRFVWRFEAATEQFVLVSASGRHTDVCDLLA